MSATLAPTTDALTRISGTGARGLRAKACPDAAHGPFRVESTPERAASRVRSAANAPAANTSEAERLRS